MLSLVVTLMISGLWQTPSIVISGQTVVVPVLVTSVSPLPPPIGNGISNGMRKPPLSLKTLSCYSSLTI